MTIDTKELRQLTQAATPGPWFSDRRGNIWRRPLTDLYENGGGVAGDKPLAFVVAGRAGEGVTGYPFEANARLIAAAPDLLEALQMLLEFPNTGPATTTARAAIAKATGEQP